MRLIELTRISIENSKFEFMTVVRPYPRWQRAIAVPGMLIFGTANVVLQKLLFEQTAQGIDEYGVHKFEKPWFQTNVMFLAMSIALIAYEIEKCISKKCKEKSDQQRVVSFNNLVFGKETSESNMKPMSKWKPYFLVSIPALLDLFGTTLTNVGLIYINASVWQMLRGSMVIFTSLFCAFILKRPHYPYMWWAVLIIAISLSIVGSAAVASTGVSKEGVSQGKIILAILITVGAQVVQASQIVVEDHLMHNIDVSPFVVVGFEGVWGSIFTWAIFVPLNQFAFKSLPEGEGLHEDIVDTFKMLSNNSLLILFTVIFMFVALFYNITEMFVTNVTSAVMRTILEGLRTLCIWIVQLIIYYSLRNTEYGMSHPEIGEVWDKWSWLQLAGFVLYLFGMFVYNKVIKFPCFNYPEPPKEATTTNSLSTQSSINAALLIQENEEDKDEQSEEKLA